MKNHRKWIFIILFLSISTIFMGTKEICAEVQFKKETFAKSYHQCKPQDKECTKISLEYPKFTGGTSSEALKKMNSKVMGYLLRPVSEGKPTSLDGLAKQLFSEYAKMRKEFPERDIPYEVERNVTAKQINSKILTLAMSEYTFLGGAHPNTFQEFANLDPQTGEVYAIQDLMKPGSEKKLTEIAERIFRKNQDIPPGKSLEQAGYFFENGKFKLNNNFLIDEKGITFWFNPYEVAPYVVGNIEIPIPLSSLKPLLKPNGPMG